MNDPVLTESAPAGRGEWLKVNPPVFFISAALILAFSFYGAVFSEQAGRVFGHVQSWIVDEFGWFYIGSVAGFLMFVLFL